MSEEDDTRVLNMRINNKEFLKGTSDSLRALDTLNKGIDNAGKGAGMQNLSKSVDTVRTKFGAMQVAGVTALATITNKAVNAGLRLVKSLTITPILDGFREYEKLLTATQTIAANTNNNNAKGIKLVGTYLDDLNHYSDLTIYNFGQMADNLGRFTAAGVSLDKATIAIKGLSNAAALAGSTNEQLGTAMYQVSQALATGTIKLMDWNSLSNAGLGGKNIQKAFIETAKAVTGNGKAIDASIKKYGSFRESLRSGWLTADIFTKSMKVFAGQTLSTSSSVKDLQKLGLDKLTISAVKAGRAFKLTEGDVKSLKDKGFKQADIDALQLGRTVGFTAEQLQKLGYSKKAAKQLSQLAKDAQDSATKVKTFSQMIGVLKEAVGSGFAGAFRQLFGNLGESSKLWTSVSNKITGAIGRIFDGMNIMLNTWHNLKDTQTGMNGYQLAWAAIGNIFKSIGNLLKPFVTLIQSLLPASGDAGTGMFSLTQAFYKFSVMLERVTSGASFLNPVMQVLGAVIGTVFGSFFQTLKIMAPLAQAIGGLVIAVGGLIDRLLDTVGIGGGVLGFFQKLGNIRADILAPIVDALVLIVESLTALVNGDIDADAFAQTLKSAFGGLFETGQQMGSDLIAGLREGFSSGSITDAISRFVNGFVEFFKGLLGIHSPSTVFEEFGKNIVQGLANGLLGALSLIGESIKALGDYLKDVDRFDVANIVSVLLGGAVFVTIKRFLDALRSGMSTFKGFADDIRAQVTGKNGILAQTTNTMKTMQNSLRAKMLKDIAIAIGILAVSLYILAKIPAKKLAVGMLAITGMMYQLMNMMKVMAAGAVTTKTAIASITAMGFAMILMAGAILLLSAAVLAFGNMDTETLVKGLAAVAVALGILSVASLILSKAAPSMILAAGGILILSVALGALAPVILLYSKIKWSTLFSGLLKMGAALIALGIAMIPLSVMAPLLLIASAALVVLAVGLTAMLAVIGLFDKVSWGTIIGGVSKIAAALIILGLASLIAAPGLILLGAAAVLLGAGLLAAGLGLTLAGAGLAVLVAAGAAGVAVFVASIEGFMAILPLIGVQLVAALDSFLKAVAEKAPSMIDSVVKIGTEILRGIRDLAPEVVKTVLSLIDTLVQGLIDNQVKMVNAAVDLIVGLVDALLDEDNKSKLITAGTDLIVAIIEGIGDAAERLVTAAGETLLSFLTALNTAITVYQPQIMEQGRLIAWNLLQGLVTGLIPQPILDAIGDLVDNMVNFFKGLLGINSPSTVFAGFGRDIVMGLIQGIGNLIGSIGGVMGRVGSAITGGFRSALKTAASLVTSGVSNIVSAFGSLPGKILAVAKSVGSAAKQVGADIINGIGKGVGGAKNWISNMAGDLRKAINSGLGLPKDIGFTKKIFGKTISAHVTIPGFARGVTGFRGGPAVVGENGPEVVTLGRGSNVLTNENLIKFMKTVSALTRKLAKGGSENSSGGITYTVDANFRGNPHSSGVAFAANIAAGLINGLKANQNQVNQTMAGVGIGAAQSFADVLGINSPSTVFHQFAGYVGQGFINGLLASVKGVQNAAIKMAGAAAEVVSATITDNQLKLEAMQAKADAYASAAKNKKLSKAQRKKLAKEAKALDKAADAQAKIVEKENAATARKSEFERADSAGKAAMKTEDAQAQARAASSARQKAEQLSKEADLIRKKDKKRAAELDRQAKIFLDRSKTYAERAAAYAQQAADFEAQAKNESPGGGGPALNQVVSDEAVAKAQATFDEYAKSLAEAQELASKEQVVNNTLNQNNYSPEAISPSEAYRNGKSLVSVMERKLTDPKSP